MKHRFVIEWRQVDYVVGNRKIANTGKFFGGDVLCGGISNIYASCKEEAVEIFRGCNHCLKIRPLNGRGGFRPPISFGTGRLKRRHTQLG